MLYYCTLLRSLIVTLAATVGVSFPGSTARAEGLDVVADIPPVQALVAQVLGDRGSVSLVMRPGASPHSYAMRPSEASVLEAADLVVWIGPDLTPWLAGPIGTVAKGAEVLGLLEARGTRVLPFREEIEAGGHEEHDDHGHDHAHGDVDPHAWLSPENAMIWLGIIADRLSEIDPEAARDYERNAEIGRLRVKAAAARADAMLSGVRDRPFVVSHDALQYFEEAFGLRLAGAISLGDAVDPGPAHVAEVREALRALGVRCVFAEPGYKPGLIAAVSEGAEAETVMIDPLGTGLEPGPDLYVNMLRDLAEAIASCE